MCVRFFFKRLAVMVFFPVLFLLLSWCRLIFDGILDLRLHFMCTTSITFLQSIRNLNYHFFSVRSFFDPKVRNLSFVSKTSSKKANNICLWGVNSLFFSPKTWFNVFFSTLIRCFLILMSDCLYFSLFYLVFFLQSD